MSDKNMAIFQKIFINVPWMNRGDTVAVEYRFLIPKENSGKIRIDDWLDSFFYFNGTNRPFENAPSVAAMYNGPAINCEFVVSLHKNLGKGWEKVAYYKKQWNSWRTGFSLVTNLS
jgi:hypothetical protein